MRFKEEEREGKGMKRMMEKRQARERDV